MRARISVVRVNALFALDHVLEPEITKQVNKCALRGAVRKLHHKVQGDRRCCSGRPGFHHTGDANDYINESILVIGSPYEGLPVRGGGLNDFAENEAICDFFRTEIDRIIDHLRDPYPP